MASHDHDSDDEYTTATGYKAPQKVDLGAIVAKDEEDESLTRYKQMLLGNATVSRTAQLIDANDTRVVLPIRITLLFENHKPDVTFDLKGPVEQLRDMHAKRTVTIKEGEAYRTQLDFYVQRDIVTGLKLSNKVLKARTIPVDKSKYMIGECLPRHRQSVDERFVQVHVRRARTCRHTSAKWNKRRAACSRAVHFWLSRSSSTTTRTCSPNGNGRLS